MNQSWLLLAFSNKFPSSSSISRQHLANNLVISEKRQIVQQNRYSDMVQQLHDESHVWITKDNLEDRITPRLFRTMATTGLVTRSSNYWRYMSVPLTRERRMNLNEEKLVENSGKFYSTNDRYSPLTKLESAHRYGESNCIYFDFSCYWDLSLNNFVLCRILYNFMNYIRYLLLSYSSIHFIFFLFVLIVVVTLYLQDFKNASYWVVPRANDFHRRREKSVWGYFIAFGWSLGTSACRRCRGSCAGILTFKLLAVECRLFPEIYSLCILLALFCKQLINLSEYINLLFFTNHMHCNSIISQRWLHTLAVINSEKYKHVPIILH